MIVGNRAHPWEGGADLRNELRTTRDLIGEPAHLLVALFAMVMEPLGTAPASVGFTSLFIVGCLRMPVLLPVWRRMLDQTWIRLLLVWIAWCAISIAWSPDPIKGIDRLWNLKYFAWLFLLWPLHRHWKVLFGGFLFATLVMQGIQASGEFLHLTRKGKSLASGMRHPTMAGMWNAIALSCWLFVSVASGWRTLVLALPMAVLCGFGFVWAGQRAAVVGILVEILIANVLLGFVAKGWVKKAITRGLIGIIIVGSVYLVAGDNLARKVNQASKEATQSLQGDAPEIVETRLALWKLSLAAWQEQPIFGVGLGGYQKATADIDIAYSKHPIHTFDTSHSTYVMVLTECGVIGLGLLLAWAGAFFLTAIGQLCTDPIRIGALGGAIVWFSAAAFDSFNTRGVFLTVGVIMMALAVMPRVIAPQR